MDLPAKRGLSVLIGTILSAVLLLPGHAIAPPSDYNEHLILIGGNTLTAWSASHQTHTNAVLGVYYTKDELYQLIAQYPGWDADLMYRIMFCESGFNNRAVGDRNTPYHSYGLLQIRNLPNRNYTIEELFDPARNIEIGYEIFLKQGYGAWRNCYLKVN